MNIRERLQQGVALQNEGRLKAAEQVYREILSQYPRESNAHHLLGVIFNDRGLVAEALAAISAAMTINPAEPVYYNSLATCYLGKKDMFAAEALCRQAIALNPAYADAWANLGLALRETKRLDAADEALQKALQLMPDHTAALCMLGNLRHKQHRIREALICYERVLTKNPRHAEALKGKSEELFELARYDEAIEVACQVRKLDPRYAAESTQVIGQALTILGRIDEACAEFDRGLKESPGSIELVYMRARAKKVNRDDPFFAHLKRFEAHTDQVSGFLKARVGYALGKAHEDVGDFAGAARTYAIGAQGAREVRVVDEANLDRMFAIMQQACTAEYLSGLEGQEEGSDVPIFILGMPRSGTTLTEQIISSHPLVVPGEELQYAHEVLDRFLLPPNFMIDHNMSPAMPTQTSLKERGRMYLEKLNALKLDPDARHVTDKMPGNYTLLGLIAAMLPRAKIIHCRRDPIDNCISCYTQFFTDGHEWSYEWGEIGRQFRRYWDLMDHWRRVIPDRFYEVRYEELVARPEEGARKLLDWCGLDWDPRVMKFYESNRPVKTASITQVRQPIYGTSMGRWKKWEPYIQPLIAEISDIERAYWAELETAGA